MTSIIFSSYFRLLKLPNPLKRIIEILANVHLREGFLLIGSEGVERTANAVKDRAKTASW